MAVISITELHDQVELTLGSLYVNPVSVRSVKEAGKSRLNFTVSYGKQDETNAVAVFDLAVANSLGAALPRIPAGFAEDSTDAGECPDNIKENFMEIVNICTSLMRRDKQTRVELKKVYDLDETVPEEVTAIINDGESYAFEVEVEGYQTGFMTLSFKV